MIWLVLALVVLTLALLGALLWSVRSCVREHQADHAKCIAHVTSVSSNRFTAQLVRHLAVKFDSVENQLELGRIRNGYTGDSQSVVALWLDEQADRIEAGE